MTNFKELDLQEAYNLLSKSKVALVCTKGEKDGLYNVTPYGWFTTYDYDPVTKVLFCSDPTHQALKNVKRTKEFAICIPEDENDPIINQCGSISDPAADKFKMFNMEGKKAEKTDLMIPVNSCAGFIEFKLVKTMPESTVEIVFGEAVAAFEKA